MDAVLLHAAYAQGARDAFDAMQGPRYPRPEGVTDDQWISWYGAKRNEDGSISAPMAVEHLLPKPGKAKVSDFGRSYFRCMELQQRSPFNRGTHS